MRTGKLPVRPECLLKAINRNGRSRAEIHHSISIRVFITGAAAFKSDKFASDSVEYCDYNLVVAQARGRPCEGRIIEESFQRLKAEAGLPNVVFHSLRHSSTTYKLKLSHGDLKATQGETRHAEMDMITKTCMVQGILTIDMLFRVLSCSLVFSELS